MAFPLVQLAIGIGLQILGYILAPKPPAPEPPSLEDFKDPTAEAGRPKPVVFGSITVEGPNNLGFWDKEIVERERSGGKSG